MVTNFSVRDEPVEVVVVVVWFVLAAESAVLITMRGGRGFMLLFFKKLQAVCARGTELLECFVNSRGRRLVPGLARASDVRGRKTEMYGESVHRNTDLDPSRLRINTYRPTWGEYGVYPATQERTE
jgi:hypothetical protein